jgi:hypothetical protein
MPATQSGTNASSNAFTDAGHTAFVQPWHNMRVPSFRGGPGPFTGGQKSPRYRFSPPAASRRPSGAGWGRNSEHGSPNRERRPEPSPHPQQWRHAAAPRAFFPRGRR